MGSTPTRSSKTPGPGRAAKRDRQPDVRGSPDINPARSHWSITPRRNKAYTCAANLPGRKLGGIGSNFRFASLVLELRR